MPEGIDQGNCNKEGLNKLWEFQSTQLEHKEPLTHGHAFYYSEATGDIIRELTAAGKCWIDKSYIKQKIRKLNTINEFVGQEEFEKCRAFMKEGQLNMLEKGGAFYKKLEEFEKLIENTDFPESDIYRRDLLQKAVSTQKNINLWEMYYKGSFVIRDTINKFLSDIKLAFKED